MIPPEQDPPPPVVASDDPGTPLEPTPETPDVHPHRVPPFVRPVELVAVGTIVVADQLSKFLIKATIPLFSKKTIIPNLLDFVHVQNTGAAFGLLNAAEFPYKTALMIGIATLALVAIALYARQLGNDEQLSRYGLALILGGAFGNLIDRVLVNYVVDFIDVYWGEAHFWAFNIADAAITIGAVLVLLEMVGIGRHHHHASRPV